MWLLDATMDVHLFSVVLEVGVEKSRDEDKD